MIKYVCIQNVNDVRLLYYHLTSVWCCLKYRDYISKQYRLLIYNITGISVAQDSLHFPLFWANVVG